MRRKLEEAKSLLKFTDKSISEISEYLCFSTQSYFQNVFKKKYGMTPKKYREK
jgi:AraC-like DNA-binding protein